MDGKWQFWIDRGGTFTDIVARHPNGSLTSHKYLSEHPERYKDAAVFAMREILGLAIDDPFPSDKVHAIKMGTTVATNALLEREGEPTLLIVTKGYRDALLIGQQHRSDLFALKPTRPKPLYDHVIEIEERLRADGTVEKRLNSDAATAQLKAAVEMGLRSCAICFMHGYRYPDHEIQVAQIAKNVGFTQISTSHHVSPLMKFVSRGDTTVADAYLSPILLRYVNQVRAAVGDTPLYFMQSNGGLAEASAFEGKDAVLSGPAGGIVGAAKTASRAQADHIVGFDMGGTSTDVSHYAGQHERVFDTVVAGVRMTVPMMDIHTVAAGGGSICRYEQGRFLVGPASAGADPGPASYGRGGPITVTDCNVLLGKLQPDLFPHVFGPKGDAPLDVSATRHSFSEIARQIEADTGEQLTPEKIAEGFIAVAVEHMARAIKRVSVERGHDIKNHSLLSFGGAGGQHACLVAEALGIEQVIVPPFSGVLSALGMGLANMAAISEQSVECGLGEKQALEDAASLLAESAQLKLANQGIPSSAQELSLTAHLKYAGSDTTLAVSFGTAPQMQNTFEEAHRQQFGFIEQDTPIIVQSLEAEALDKKDKDVLGLVALGKTRDPIEKRWLHLNGDSRETAIHRKEQLQSGHVIAGPAVILENGGTTMVEPGWTAELLENDTLRLRQREQKTAAPLESDKPDPIMLEIFNNLFMSVAEEMGGVLAKTAHSVNIKERLDFSCAVFDQDGQLIANAPHMPVHLGSMGESVSAIAQVRSGSINDGDVYMVNDPYAGGTHLPDITVISPVFIGRADAPSFFVASRGHHADIGGISPGSMPPNSFSIEEEGIRFTNFELVSKGEFNESAVRAALHANAHPARNPDQNIADLKAQVAANKRGTQQVKKLVEHFGADTVHNYMRHVQDNAEEAVRSIIPNLKSGRFQYKIDCGGTVVVTITPDIETRSAVVDFTGTSPALNSNFNAPLAVTKAAVLYVFRTLTQTDIPLNAGCLKPVKLIVPENSMLNPQAPAAVVAGNVETSQAVTNALFLATGTLAAAQGTMNNFTFGNDTYQYYETIAGGTGAGHGFDGTDAIQSHMTNSRLTDPEVLEWRYPVMLDDFSVRTGSGGTGKHCGGDGARRTIRFLEPMAMSILSNHRIEGPPGLAGGAPGNVGRTVIKRLSGTETELSAADGATLEAGESVQIETPGGGGYGLIDN